MGVAKKENDFQKIGHVLQYKFYHLKYQDNDDQNEQELALNKHTILFEN